MLIDLGNPISGHSLNRGLLHWWHAVRGPTGSTLVDLCNPLTFGTLTNGPVWSYDLNEVPCLDYDGTNDYVTFGDLDDTEGVTELSVMATTYPLTTSGGTDGLRVIVTKDNGVADPTWTLRQLTGGDKCQWYVSDGVGLMGPQEFTGYVVNEWQQVLGTYKSGVGLDIYRNGFATAATGSATIGTMTTSAYPVAIGSTPAVSGRAFQGRISNVRIWNRRMLSGEAEILWDYEFTRGNSPLFNTYSTKKYFFSDNGLGAPYETATVVAVDQEFVDQSQYVLGTILSADAATGGDIPSSGGSGTLVPANTVSVIQQLLTTLTIPILTQNVLAVDQSIALTEFYNDANEVAVASSVNLFLTNEPNVLVSDRYRR